MTWVADKLCIAFPEVLAESATKKKEQSFLLKETKAEQEAPNNQSYQSLI